MSSERTEEGLPRVEVSLPEQNFEGPLDLLLALIQKHELDILNIPIAFITDKYLEFIRVMQLLNLDLASEYLVMAATLAHIKSKMLLPQVPSDQEGEDLAEDEEDPREALIRRLLEYQKYKQAAAQLGDRSSFGRDSFTRGAPLAEAVDPGLPPLAEVPLFALVEAFGRVLEQSRIKITHDVVADRISLSDRINQLVDFLREKKLVRFEELFTHGHPADKPVEISRESLVITFLALLEMTKLRMTRLTQSESLGPIFIELAEGAVSPFNDEPKAAEPGAAESASPVEPGAAESASPVEAGAAESVSPVEPGAAESVSPVEPGAAESASPVEAGAAVEPGGDVEPGAAESVSPVEPGGDVEAGGGEAGIVSEQAPSVVFLDANEDDDLGPTVEGRS